MVYTNPQHPKLIYSKDTFTTLSTETKLLRNQELTRKVANSLDALDLYATDMDYHPGKGLEPLGAGWWSLRIKSENNYWRVMFRKIPDTDKYGLVLMFQKKGNQIPKVIWDKANGIAKREGWI